MSRPAVLCVDDEPNLLKGLQLHLRRHFEVSTTSDPADALRRLEQAEGGFAVLISDLRMPGIDGIELLRRAARIAPDTARLLLTGYADLRTAIEVINEARILRFLTKPCPPARLLDAVRAGAEHYRLLRAERELLEDTLRGSLETLTNVLAMAQPLAFGRAQRLEAHVRALGAASGETPRWPAECAALLSQLGAVALPASTLERLHTATPLDEREQEMVARLPRVVDDLLEPIPRLEPVREILALVHRRYETHRSLPWGARALRIASDYDELECGGLDVELAIETLRSRSGTYDPELLERFAQLQGSGAGGGAQVLELELWQVAEGMRFVQEVKLPNGARLIARGHVASAGLIERIRNLAEEVAGLNVRVVVEEPPTRPDG